jgi:lysophospholipase L1-like esterase
MRTMIYMLIGLLSLAWLQVIAQETGYPYAADIQKFREADKLSPPPKDAILFVGSSSFAMWQDVQDYFPGYSIINRGFGGSTIADQIHYINDVVFAYSPRQIVMYCGENDLAYSDTVTGEMVAERFKTWFYMVRSEWPGVKITYVSMKPSPSRWLLKERFIEGNELIREFLAEKDNTSFVNVWEDMLNEDGKPDPAIFLDDDLHMNKKGYKIWQQAFLPYLVKE